MKVDFTIYDVVRKIVDIAAADPDYKYRDTHDRCVYVEEDATGQLVGSCIVGKALVDLGIDKEYLRDKRSNTNGIPAAWVIIDDLGLDAGTIAANWVSVVQQRQDAGATWGGAVEAADLYYPVRVPA